MENGGDFMQLCRLCLVKDQVNIPIFEDQGDIRQIFLKISSCLPVKIAPNDKLPKKICDGCSYKLDMLYEFWNTSANAEKQLVTWLDQAGFKANTETADKTMSVVAQQCSNKPSETIVKQEAMEDAAENQIFMQEMNYKEKWDEASSSAGPSATVTSDEPPPKRARRAAAVKASLNVTPESEDEDDDFDNEAMTKIENESDEEDDDDDMDDDSAYADVPSTSADDQAGPSGVGKDGVEAPLSVERHGERFYFKKYVDDLGKLVMECLICSKQFSNLSGFKIHVITHLTKKPFKCEICGKGFKRHNDRYIHMRVHAKSQYQAQCEICKKTLSSQHHLNNHIKRHNKEFDFTCDKCNMGFVTRSEFKTHCYKKHSGIKHTCVNCEKTYCDKQALLDHIRTVHENIEPEFHCMLCDIKFKIKKRLRYHNDKHHSDKVKSYICDICGKSVSSPHSLRTHIQIHKGIKPHSCPSCDMRFTTKNTLRLHIRKHTGEKPYECKVCKKKFSQQSSRNLHFKRHSDVKPFTCDICEGTFVSQGVLNMHKKAAHKIILPHSKIIKT